MGWITPTVTSVAGTKNRTVKQQKHPKITEKPWDYKEKSLIIEIRVILAQISKIREIQNARQGYHNIHI
jgi:hypothetical protein